MAKSTRCDAFWPGFPVPPSGSLIATVFRMMMPLIKRRDVIGLILLVAVLVAIGVARLPLQAVLLVAIPISLAVTSYMRRRVSA